MIGDFRDTTIDWTNVNNNEKPIQNLKTEFKVDNDGIYQYEDLGDNIFRKTLIMPKDIFIEAVNKYCNHDHYKELMDKIDDKPTAEMRHIEEGFNNKINLGSGRSL